MAKIAVVGAGIAGCAAANGLVKHGYEVTLFSDKTPEDFLTKAHPTGSANRYNNALEVEREFGLEHWGDVVAPDGEPPQATGGHVHLCAEKGNVILTMAGRLENYCLGIDPRLQSATWIRDVEERGGSVEIENVEIERLEDIARTHDLTIVAGGKYSDIRQIFERDEAKSRNDYRSPQRALAMVSVKNVPVKIDYVPWLSVVKFNIYESDGEMFWCPWYSKDGDQAWALIFEWKEGAGYTFEGLKDGGEYLMRAKDVIREWAPWDYEWVKDAELCDENAWIAGAFVPQVRKVAGTLPSGRHVMALGDMAHALDPIGGQGANNGEKMARAWVNSIVERGEGPFDAEWMLSTHEKFWATSKYSHILNNAMLDGLPEPGEKIVTAAYGSTGRPDDDSPQQKVADRWERAFDDPREIAEAMFDEERADALLAEAFGSAEAAEAAIEEAETAIEEAQERQKAGQPANHPIT